MSLAEPIAPAGAFYVAGGTLSHDSRSYVERQADRDLFEGLRAGEYCYVLTSRQMGKSSLMVRTAARLRQAGVDAAVLDLTALGRNVTPEQWYGGLLGRLGQHLRVEDELESFWLASERLGPLQRFMAALEHVVLRPCASRSPGGQSTEPDCRSAERPEMRQRPVVIFIDEIDVVRSLPFSTDEFFAGIRECYNRRTEDPAFHQLTFCLLGVATPSDLIQDQRTTPFNIGRRIELTDFSLEEAGPLAPGLDGSIEPTEPQSVGWRLLQRILHWTGGHPYLTQRLCQAVAAERIAAGHLPAGGRATAESTHSRTVDALSIRTVDRLCADLFLSASAQERDDNLLFVRERVLRSPRPDDVAGSADLAAVLDLYARILARRRVPYDDTSPLVSALRLAGVIRVAESKQQGAEAGASVRKSSRAPYPTLRASAASLRVRNRIYERVFDRRWVLAHMPDAELRRQRAAYRLGVFRAAGLASVVLTVVAILALTVSTQAVRYRRLAREEARQRQSAEESLYVADMNVANQALAEGNLARARDLVDAHGPLPGSRNLPAFEWLYLWQHCQSDARLTLPAHRGMIAALGFTRDGKALSSAGRSGSEIVSGSTGEVKLWDLSTQRAEMLLSEPMSGSNRFVAFSSDLTRIASGSEGNGIRLWETGATPGSSPRLVATLPGHPGGLRAAVYSPDSRRLVSLGRDNSVRLWNADSGALTATYQETDSLLACATLSPDGRVLAVGGTDATVALWDVSGRRTIATIRGHTDTIFALAFSPDGRLLASGSWDGTVRLWEVPQSSGPAQQVVRELAVLREHKDGVYALAFSPAGAALASGSMDGTIKLWDVARQSIPSSTPARARATLMGHTAEVAALAFSPDGRALASGSWDGAVKIWDLAAVPGGDRLTEAAAPVVYSSDSRLLATGCAGTGARIWDLSSGRRVRSRLDRLPVTLQPVAFSPDGRTLVLDGSDRRIRFWNLDSDRQVAALPGPEEGSYSTCLSPDGRTLAIGYSSGSIAFWHLDPERDWRASQVALLVGHGGPVECLAFSSGGRYLASGGADAAARLWEITDPGGPRLRAVLRGHARRVRAVAFSPDDATLATGSHDNTVKFWDLATRRERMTLHGHRRVIRSVAFSPDGRTLATESGDRTVKLWHVASRREMMTFPGHTGSGAAGDRASLGFSPDGRVLAMGNLETVRLWRAASPADVARAGVRRDRERAPVAAGGR